MEPSVPIDPRPSLATVTVRELRRDRSRAPGGAAYPSLIKALLPLVCGRASLVLPEDPARATQIIAAAFNSIRLRWRKLPRRTLLASYLLRTVWSLGLRERRRLLLGKDAPSSAASVHPLAVREFQRLPELRLDILILRYSLRQSVSETSKALRISEKKTIKLSTGALAKLTRTFSKRGIQQTPEALLESVATPLPPDLESRLLDQIEQAPAKSKRDDLVQGAVRMWQWIRIKRVLSRTLATIGAIVCILLILGFSVAYLARQGYLTAWFLRLSNRQLAKEMPQIAVPARPWPTTREAQLRAASQSAPKTSAELFSLTNIWTCQLSLTRQQWERLQPARVAPVSLRGPDGQMVLRNPNARRSGLAGVLGLDFNWTEAALEFANQPFAKVAVRYRGNGTYVNSLFGPKQSIKVDLNKFSKGQNLAGVHTLNLVNAIPDNTYMRDALAEQLFRDLGVPGPRTGYAYLTMDVPGKLTRQPLGLYLLIENIDADFASARFQSKHVPIFKPVTTQLFDDLGKDWKQYAPIYDLKTKATTEQQQRLIDFAQLVAHAPDPEFARRLPEFLDLDEFAGFLAGHVLLASYDGFLTNGQNYYLFLDPHSNRFGLIPWDQDHSWGEFGYVATAEKREQASIWEPSTYHHRFLTRVLKVELFRTKYRRTLERALADLFTTERLSRQIDELASVIRPAVAAESDFRLQRFDLAISTNWIAGPRDGAPEGPKAPVHQLRRFIANRARSIRDQLDDKSSGVLLSRHGPSH